MKYSSFEEMPVWKDAMDLSISVFDLTISLPRCEDYGLTSQVRRSVTSIAANIAEGFGRSTNLDKSRFYIMARGSAYETINHILYGNNVGYFDQTSLEKLKESLLKNIHDLNKIIHYLKTKP